MTTTKRIPADQLESYFDAFSKHHLRYESTNAVDVEVLGPDLGDQFEVEGAHLTGVTYDPRSNAFELMFETGDHRVYAPAEVWVTEEPNGFVSGIEVVRKGGIKDVIRLKRQAVQPASNRAADRETRPP